MIDPNATLRQVMEAVFNRWGTAAVLYDISVHLTWNARWAPAAMRADIEQAGHAIGQAAIVVEKLEEAEQNWEKQK